MGNGLKLIAEEMKEYPQIELRWHEVGLSFQVQFIKRDFNPTQQQDVGIKQQLLTTIKANNSISARELAQKLDITSRHCERLISELRKEGVIKRVGSKKAGRWEII